MALHDHLKNSGVTCEEPKTPHKRLSVTDIDSPHWLRTLSENCLLLGESPKQKKTYKSQFSYEDNLDKTVKTLIAVKEMKEPTQGKVKLNSIFKMICEKGMDLSMALETLIPVLKENIALLKSKEYDEKLEGLNGTEIIIVKAWFMSGIGRDLAYALCNILRDDGGLDELIKNAIDLKNEREIRLKSSLVLSQSLTTEYRDYVANRSLEQILNLAKEVKNDREFSQETTAILNHLFKHSKKTCSQMIDYGGLDTIIYSCRSLDPTILRRCSMALTNLSIYGGRENQNKMISCNVPAWLFPLAFSDDDSTQYYALLAISILCANEEIESAVVASGTLDLVAPFLRSHDPISFIKSDPQHKNGQSKEWLARLLRFLSSCQREEAKSLMAFHFAMEAGVRREQKQLKLFESIGAIIPLKNLVSGSCKLASKYASQALRIIGQILPQKLPSQVPLWTTENVMTWVKQLGLSREIAAAFIESRIDGDLLLLLNDDCLKNDLQMTNGIIRKRFMRDLNELKQTSDYQSLDSTHLNDWLNRIAPEFCRYTYRMLKSHVNMKIIKNLTEQNLIYDCGINNGIHRMLIIEAAKKISSHEILTTGKTSSLDLNILNNENKNIDVFISYRRKNGALLASLIKVHLHLRGYSVFIDIEKLSGGKFDVNLLNSISRSRCFILVLTSEALDRCIGDVEGNDWIHREVAAAIKNGCQIIPIFDNFEWPAKEKLPEDIQDLPKFNGVTWNHDLQDACIFKICNYIDFSVNGIITHESFNVNQYSSPTTASATRRPIRELNQTRRVDHEEEEKERLHDTSNIDDS